MHDFAQKFADRALKSAARFWFSVTVGGQLFFAFAVAAFYGLTAARGEMQAWNRRMMHGHEAGDTVGNFAVAMHLLAAVVIILAGAIQFVPQVRDRFPLVHRWIGRIYMLAAFALSTAGLFMLWLRPSVGDFSLKLGTTGNVAVIWLCAVMALRYAIGRKLAAHRRWALRLFLSVSANFFFRIAFFFTLIVFKRPVGFDPKTFSGPLLTFLAFASYLVPLAIAELYFRAQERPGVLRRVAMATGLVVLTLAMSAGIFATAVSVWIPNIKAAFDTRTSIARTLTANVDSKRVDVAIKHYQKRIKP